MAIRARIRQQSAYGRWTEEERNKLWRLRQQHPRLSWEEFNGRFFPLRSKAALTKAYLDMKMQGRFNNSNDVSQNNKRKLPVKETTAKKIKRQQTSSSSSAESFVGSSEEFESASSPEDSETENSDAGDIPYEKDLPRQVLHKPPPPRNLLSVVSRPRLTARRTGGNRLLEKAANTTLRPVKVQSSPYGDTAAPSASRATRNQRLPINSATIQGLVTVLTAGIPLIKPKTTNKPATDAAPELPDETYSLLSRSFHYAANIFAQYPQVTARAEKAEKENAEKDSYIKELRLSHEAELSDLRDRSAVQNKTMSEQRAVIECFQKQLKLRESQACRVQDLELELAVLKKALNSSVKVESFDRAD